MHLHYVGVSADAGLGFGLSLEARLKFVVASEGQGLDGDLSTGLKVSRQVDRSHAPGPQRAQNLQLRYLAAHCPARVSCAGQPADPGLEFVLGDQPLAAERARQG